jgi:glutamine synthetase
MMLGFAGKQEAFKYILASGIQIINLCHTPEDGRLKTLSFVATDRKRVYEILELGERVDGSSLFSFMEAGKSDLYIMPKLERAFISPFSKVPTLNFLCEYLDENGNPLNNAPQSILERAEQKLSRSYAITLKALAELEFYIISKQKTETLFQGPFDKNYQESAPFAAFEDLRNEALVTLRNIGILTKYGHSEVGRIFGKDDMVMEQHEIEFTPLNLANLAEEIPIAKWVIRNICAKYGVSVSFSPKLIPDHAGNGMHVHLCALRKNKNIVAGSDETPGIEALKMIGGMLKLASSLAAFGNTTPISYLRFVTRKESPMHICWGTKNRLALIRIPLWWSFKQESKQTNYCRETFEYRGPDALSNPYLLLAGITMAIDHGLENGKEALTLAQNLNVEKADNGRSFEALPSSCSQSAENLKKDRRFYEADRVFSGIVIDKTIQALKSYDDRNLWAELAEKPREIEMMLKGYLHYG